MIPYWWNQFPGRLEAEEQALTEEGIRVKRDESAFRRGVLRLELTLPPGKWLTEGLIAVYPDTFPYLRPEVYAPHVRLARHQNPFKRNLCLLGGATEYWTPSTTLAGLLRSQLPLLTQVLQAEETADVVGLEDPQGEPLSAYFEYEQDSIVLVDSSWNLPPEVAAGHLEFTLLDGKTSPFRAAVLRVSDPTGQVIARSPFGANDAVHLRGRWTRVAEPVVEELPDRFIEAAGLREDIQQAPWHGDTQVLGVVFPEELGHRRTGAGWLFVVRRKGNAKGFRPGHNIKATFARSGRLGVGDLSARVPAFRHLMQASIAVFGTGCLGAPSLLELAKAGVGTIHFLDADTVDAGTIVRWPFGLPAVGRDKVKALFQHVNAHYPWVKLFCAGHRLGGPEPPMPERDVLERVLEGVDLVYDALAETGLQYLLSDLARQRGIPYLALEATQGGVGGTIARLTNNGGGPCWGCLQMAIGRGEIPKPPEDAAGSVQPEGCQRVTYVGAHFDLQEIALQGVRMAVATLMNKYDPEYGDFPWDVGVLSLRDAKGVRTEPRWSVHTLAKRNDCPVCQ